MAVAAGHYVEGGDLRVHFRDLPIAGLRSDGLEGQPQGLGQSVRALIEPGELHVDAWFGFGKIQFQKEARGWSSNYFELSYQAVIAGETLRQFRGPDTALGAERFDVGLAEVLG